MRTVVWTTQIVKMIIRMKVIRLIAVSRKSLTLELTSRPVAFKASWAVKLARFIPSGGAFCQTFLFVIVLLHVGCVCIYPAA
jgi:hypothetical protein